jgi:hypothetical protein
MAATKLYLDEEVEVLIHLFLLVHTHLSTFRSTCCLTYVPILLCLYSNPLAYHHQMLHSCKINSIVRST